MVEAWGPACAGKTGKFAPSRDFVQFLIYEDSSHRLDGTEPPLSLLRRYGETGDFYIDAAQVVAAGEV